LYEQPVMKLAPDLPLTVKDIPYNSALPADPAS